MDICALERVIALKGVKPAQKWVLAVLAVARPIGVVSLRATCRVGAFKTNSFLYEVEKALDSKRAATLKSISEMTNYSIRQVRNILNDLCKMGLVRWDGENYVIQEDSGLHVPMF